MKATLKFLLAPFALVAVTFLAGCGTMGASEMATEDRLEKMAGDAVVFVDARYDGSTVVINRKGARALRQFGSDGIAITPRHVLTVRHGVAYGPTEVYVKTNTGKYKLPAKVIWEDQETDAAVLEITSKMDIPSWVPLKIGAPVDGEKAVAMGYPQGEWLVSSGYIIGDTDGVYRMIDARTDYGSSGSAVFNSKGELIGLKTLIRRSCFGTNTRIVRLDGLPPIEPWRQCTEVVSAARICERYGKCAELSAPKPVVAAKAE